MKKCKLCERKHYARDLCRRHYYQLSEVKERVREYNQRPDIKERKREYNQRPEVKEKARKKYIKTHGITLMKRRRHETFERIYRKFKNEDEKYLFLKRVLKGRIDVGSDIMKMNLKEYCNMCGESVAFGSEKFVNRIPDLNTLKHRTKMSVKYPEGNYRCETCDKKWL